VIAVRVWLWRALAVLAGVFKQDNLKLRWWEKILAKRPDHVQALASVAHLRAARGEYLTATKLLESALALQPSNVNHWYNLGFVEQCNGSDQRALVAFDKAIELNTRFDLAYYGKAVSLVRLSQLDAAVTALKINTQLQPMSPYGWYQLAHVYFQLHDLDSAKKIIARLNSFEPAVAKRLQHELQLSPASR
jgi:tetratricopeptide (TPR) repeat protein